MLILARQIAIQLQQVFQPLDRGAAIHQPRAVFTRHHLGVEFQFIGWQITNNGGQHIVERDHTLHFAELVDDDGKLGAPCGSFPAMGTGNRVRHIQGITDGGGQIRLVAGQRGFQQLAARQHTDDMLEFVPIHHHACKRAIGNGPFDFIHRRVQVDGVHLLAWRQRIAPTRNSSSRSTLETISCSLS